MRKESNFDFFPDDICVKGKHDFENNIGSGNLLNQCMILEKRIGTKSIRFGWKSPN